MTRKRAHVVGGYGRKTVSLPTAMMEEIDRFLTKQEGMTWSMFLTDAGRKHLQDLKRQGRR